MTRTLCVVGGGIAGVSCMLELIENAEQDKDIEFVFICGKSGFIKTVENYEKVGVLMEKFDVKVQVPDQEFFKSKKIRIFMENVDFWDSQKKFVRLSNSETVHYHLLCIATGGIPKTISDEPNDYILQIRDTDTIDKLQKRLSNARRVMIIGDGGISMESAYELKNVEIYWATKSAYIGTPFFDATLGLSLEERFRKGREEGEQKKEVVMDSYAVQTSESTSNKSILGSSLGPHWLAKLKQHPNEKQDRKLTIMRCIKVVKYHTDKPPDCNEDKWNIYVEFNDGQIIGCDFVIEALGVVPNSARWKEWCPELKLANDMGIEVDEKMKTSIENVFACGDVCTIHRTEQPRIWKQMRLWSQARILGIYTARCMLDPETELDAWFDMFVHLTTFAGYKIVLLGDFLAETDDVEHVSNESTLTRVAFENNHVVGAILIGPTDLDEVFETLILNSFDISDLPRPICNQQIDLADYFD